jgi:hypothetical protein
MAAGWFLFGRSSNTRLHPVAARHLFSHHARRSVDGRPNPRAMKIGDDKMSYNLRDYSGEYFIKLDDVREKPLRRRITNVRKGNYDKLELVFDSGEVLSLNATNTRALSRVYGGSSDALIGKVVDLEHGQLRYQGADHDAVLVKPITQPEPPPFDDEIPI